MALEIAPPKRDLPRTSTRSHERDAVWRLCGWGTSAVAAAGMLALTIQSDIGRTRIDSFLGNALPSPPTVVAQGTPRTPEKDPETLRLQAEVRALIADRDRIATRFATLERHLDEVTGSVQKHAAAPTLAPTAPPPQVATVSAMPAAPAKPAIPAIDPLAMPAITGSIGGWPKAAEPEEEPARAAALETKDVPRAPTPLAALPAQEEPVSPGPRLGGKAEYGIDLGGARDMEALRQRWAGIKANLGPLLTGLQPIAVRDRKPGSTELRLVVGPMPNLAAARQVCTRFAAAHVSCQAAKFDGESIVQR
jgi:hypothetical protein